MNKTFDAYYYLDDEDQPVRVKSREKFQKEPKIMFARWGHMNPKRDKTKEKTFQKSEAPFVGFHTPPEHVGIYAYIWPYIEPFLVAWNKEMMVKTGTDEEGQPTYRFPPIKKFKHYGDIWTHLLEPAKKLGLGKEYKGSWVKVDTKDLPKLLAKTIASDIAQLKGDEWMGKPKDIANPYKRGKGGFMSKDHLEVFIPGKVRESP